MHRIVLFCIRYFIHSSLFYCTDLYHVVLYIFIAICKPKQCKQTISNFKQGYVIVH